MVELETAVQPDRLESLPSEGSASIHGHWTQPVSAWFFRREVACMLELEQLDAFAAEMDDDPQLPEGCSFREAQPAELSACARLAGAPTDEYVRRWMGGDLCYALFRNARPINLNWLHFGSCYVRGMGLLIRAAASECYLYNVFTDPGQRGMGIYKATQRVLIKLLAARGVTRIRQLVMRDNRVPQTTLPKLGYTLTQWLRYTGLLGGKYVTISDAGGELLSRQLRWKAPAGVFRI